MTGTPNSAALLAVLVWASLAVSPSVAAESYQDWLRSQALGVRDMDRQYQVYRSEQDQQFSRHLKAQWQEFQVFQGKVRDPRPKPAVIPVAPLVAKVPSTPPLVPPDLPQKEIARPADHPIKPTPQPPAKPPAATPDSLEVIFYGNPVRLPYDSSWCKTRVLSRDPQGFAGFWDTLSASRSQPTLQAIARARQELGLDDWGHVALWREVARALQPDHPAEQQLLLWHFLVKAGVDVRLGYSDQDIHLFLAVKQPVYSVSYTRVGDRTYYALLNADRGKNLRSFHTYETPYPAPLRPLDLTGAATNFTRAAPTDKLISFPHQGRQITIRTGYDRRLVDYLASFPQLDFELYFATQASPAARSPLLQALRSHLQGLSEEEAVNFLLAFVQKGFAYKTDADQFGYEKYFFVEEALHYPYSDCEDRSALFAWLVRELLGLKTVGLHYPGHMTTGVALLAHVPHKNWTTVEWQGQRYVIADPTYINAGVGMAMPGYAQLQPLRVIATR